MIDLRLFISRLFAASGRSGGSSETLVFRELLKREQDFVFLSLLRKLFVITTG